MSAMHRVPDQHPIKWIAMSTRQFIGVSAEFRGEILDLETRAFRMFEQQFRRCIAQLQLTQ